MTIWDLVIFSMAWWLNNIGVLLYITYILWTRNIGEFGLNTIILLLFAFLTKEYHFNCHIFCDILNHIFILTIVCSMYIYPFKRKILYVGAILLGIFPNDYNPYNGRLIFKIIVYCYIMFRIKKSPGLLVTKYICFAWILFTHEVCMIMLPLQIVYDTYYYKTNFNIV